MRPLFPKHAPVEETELAGKLERRVDSRAIQRGSTKTLSSTARVTGS